MKTYREMMMNRTRPITGQASPSGIEVDG